MISNLAASAFIHTSLTLHAPLANWARERSPHSQKLTTSRCLAPLCDKLFPKRCFFKKRIYTSSHRVIATRLSIHRLMPSSPSSRVFACFNFVHLCWENGISLITSEFDILVSWLFMFVFCKVSVHVFCQLFLWVQTFYLTNLYKHFECYRCKTVGSHK